MMKTAENLRAELSNTGRSGAGRPYLSAIIRSRVYPVKTASDAHLSSPPPTPIRLLPTEPRSGY